VKYYAAVCSGTTQKAARYMSDKLGNKEFDEEDFYITP
jgi:hypothetical protein